MITVKEIAKLAGVSAKTAERALSGETKGKRRDAGERAERVRKIAVYIAASWNSFAFCAMGYCST